MPNKTKEKMVSFSFRVEESIVKKLEHIKEKTGAPLTYHIKMALEKYLKTNKE